MTKTVQRINHQLKAYYGQIVGQLLMVCCLLVTTVAAAQVYPVQVNPQLIPPYSLKLSDYQTTSSEKLFVNILLTDTQDSGRQVRLKMYIEGQGLNIRTLDFVAGATPIFLDGGVNLRLSNLDLHPYFSLNNLLGITPQQYNQPLPDGRYDFCFEVYDQLSGQLLSQKRCTSVYLLLNDPPILNVPNRGDLVTAQNPQNIIFNWTPRHLNATGVQYEFTLKELWDTGLDPQAAFLASPPLYQEITFAPTLLYGPANIQLIEGKVYGWQVRALVSDGISETSVFRNNGFSEIYHFKYEGNCAPPQFILSEAQNTQTVEITWQYAPHIRYEIQYRKKGYGDADWFSLYAYNNQHSIHNLEAGTTYEFRVGGECTPFGGFAFSQIYEFTTPTEEETAYYNCGVLPEVEIANQDPLQNIGVNEVFTAGDFPVTVKEVINSGGGVFSGWGFITVPYLSDTRIRVEFYNIHINTDFQLVQGVVETSYDPDWSGMVDVGQTVDQIGQLLENWTGTPEQIEELEKHRTVLTNELENAIAESGQDVETVAGLQEAKENLDSSTSALINEGENPKEESITAVKTTSQQVQEGLRDAEANRNIQKASGGSQITGDGYFDGVIDFTVADNAIKESPEDGPQLVDLSQMLPENDEEEYVRITETALGNNKQLVVSTSNMANIDSDEEIAQIKERMASVGNMDYMLWIHYDLKASQVKYKVAFGNNYYPDNLIAQNEVVELMNEALSFDLREAIGSSIVALSMGLDTLLETYHAQLPQLDTEIIAGATAYDLLKFGLGFARECGEGYGGQEAGLVPRCLWDTENPLAFSNAYYAGFIDGAWEIAEMGYSIAEFSGAWNPLHPVFHTQTGMDIRQKTMDVLAMLEKLASADDTFGQVKSLVKNEVVKYIDETVSLNAQGRYNQGKLIFEVASAFFGVAEAKALLKTGKLTSNLLSGLAKIPVRLSNVSKVMKALPGKLKKLQNNTLAYIISLNTYVVIARYTDDGVLIATKWVDEPIEVVESIGEVIYKKADDLAENTSVIGIVKDANGGYGLSNALSLIRQLITKPTYRPFRTIYSNPNTTTTLIGKWDEILNGSQNGLKKVRDELVDADLNIYMQSGKFENKGGFNMLSIEGWNTKVVKEATDKGISVDTKAFDDFIWEKYNKPWLESALQRGDEIILWSDPTLNSNLEVFYQLENIQGMSFYGREIDFIKKNASKYGYNFTEALNSGTLSK